MFENLIGFFKKMGKKEGQIESKNNKDEAKERLHLVLMQDRANVSADFLDMMRQEIIDVIKKYIDVEDGDIDVRLTNKQNSDGTTGAPALYANIPIKSIKNETRKMEKEEISSNVNKEEIKEENKETKNENQSKNEETKQNTIIQNKEEKEVNTISEEIEKKENEDFKQIKKQQVNTKAKNNKKKK